MTSMWKRGSQRHYPGVAIAAARLSNGNRNLPSWPEKKQLSSTDSPP
jgi:hypothetical protein